jgi:hypothetical protein
MMNVKECSCMTNSNTIKNHSLLTILVICTCFFGVSFSSIAQKNIALKANVSTSHVSSWETLGAVNDGYEPFSSSDKSHGLYGNWPSHGKWNWVEYSWDSFYAITKSEMYWFTDYGGVRIPDSSYIEYWDVVVNKWQIMPNHSGFLNKADQYCVVTFDTVYTKRIRVHCKSNIESTGILEWKIYGEPAEALPGMATFTTSKELALSTTSTIKLKLKDSSGIPVAGYAFIYDVIIVNDLDLTQESYLVNGISYSETVLRAQLPVTNATGEVTFDVTMPASIDPGDGIYLKVYFKNGLVQIGKLSYYQQKLKSPILSADSTNNSVDFDIDLTYSQNTEWSNKIYKITIDGKELNQAGYALFDGKITLKPSSLEKSLTTSGLKEINIYSYGYETVMLKQEIAVGELSIENSDVKTELILCKYQNTKITCSAKDQYSNPIKGLKLMFDIVITNNNSTTSEQYRLNNKPYLQSASAIDFGTTTDKGYAEIPIEMPDKVDVNDGVSIIVKKEDNTIIGQLNYTSKGKEKAIYLQIGIKNHSDFSWKRTAQSANFILYWGSKIQGDPRNASNGDIKFDPSVILQALENVLYFWTDSIQFIQNPDEYNMGKYKFEVVLNETWSSGYTGWAFGGLADNEIGGMWIHPLATASGGGALAHEFGHMCQAMIFKQYPGNGLNTPWAGFFWESHTCFMDWFYKDYNYDFGLERFTMNSCMQYSSTRKYYENVIFLQYIYEKYGLQTIHDIWRKGNPKVSHPLTSLRDSVLRYTQSDLNDDFGHHAMRNVTWDYESKAELNSFLHNDPRLNLYRTYTILESMENMEDWYIVPREMAPGDYGYNIVPFFPNEGTSNVGIDFYGYDNKPSGGAGWRYGIVEVDANGNAKYSELYRQKEGSVNYTITAGNKYYFVVSAAPAVHHNYNGWIGFPKEYRYPYRLRFNGALPAGHKVGYNSMKDQYAGAPHANGGGWVATTAKVASTAYVGPNAQVLGYANVTGKARIEDYAIVQDRAQISGNAKVRNWAVVAGNSTVAENAVVEERARLRAGTNIRNNAIITGSAQVLESTITGNAVVKDLAFLWGVTLSGTAVLGGNSEHFNDAGKPTTAGVYLQVHNTEGRNSIDGLDYHKANIDLNPFISDYLSPNGDYPATVINLRTKEIYDNSVVLEWEIPDSKYGMRKYFILQNDKVHSTTSDRFIKMENLNPKTTYSFKVMGLDSVGNYTPLSNPVTFQTYATSVSGVYDDGDRFKVSNYFKEKRIEIKAPDEIKRNVMEIYTISGKIITTTSFIGETSVAYSEIGNEGVYIIKLNNGKLIEIVKISNLFKN